MSFGPGTLRICLALAVVASHLSRWDFGRPAVMLFFMLSGYWVAKMQDGQHQLPIPLYIVSRWLRIWPAMAVTAIGTATALQPIGLIAGRSLSSTVALIGLYSRDNDIVGTIWSLDIEFQFYVLLPLLLAAKYMIGDRLRLIALAITSYVIGMTVFNTLGAKSVLIYSPMFLAGVGIYLLGVKSEAKEAMGGAAITFFALTALNSPWLDFRHFDIQITRDAIFMLACLPCVPFIAWNVRQKSCVHDRFLGNLSFPLYLVHEPIIRALRVALGNYIAWKLVAILLSVVAALALYIVIDRPVDRFRTKATHAFRTFATKRS